MDIFIQEASVDMMWKIVVRAGATVTQTILDTFFNTM
jgi:hypothetical protein